jgi:hypothetical protein
MLALPHPSATDKVRVYEGQRLVLARLLQPGHSVSIRLLHAGNQRWLIEQATEPLTLAVRVLIKPHRVNGNDCLTYVPPTVHLKSVAHSH